MPGLDDAQPAESPPTRDRKDPTSASESETDKASIELHDWDDDLLQRSPSFERQVFNLRALLSPNLSLLLERTPMPEHPDMPAEAGDRFLPDSKRSPGQRTPPLESQIVYVSHERSSEYLPAPSRSLPPKYSARAQNSKRRRPKIQASQGDAWLLQFMIDSTTQTCQTKRAKNVSPGRKTAMLILTS